MSDSKNGATRFFLTTWLFLTAATVGVHALMLSFGSPPSAAIYCAMAITSGTFCTVLLGSYSMSKEMPTGAAAIAACGMTVVSTFFAASRSLQDPLIFGLGFAIAVATVIFGIRRELDDHVPGAILMLAVTVQISVIMGFLS